ncbi:MAG TPA: DEAD/DEAH box helicase [Thermoanaerobaculia bacterium]|nr:DEAD/DEAH box helicase [Thermoanaerobaculia bacterium]
MPKDPLAAFHPAVRSWFASAFPEPTAAQRKGWPAILEGRSTLLLAPTGSGKTLAAFLAAIDRLMFTPEPSKKERLRVLYVSPLKALAVDVERNLRAPIAGIAAAAAREGIAHRVPAVAIRSGDTPASERAKIARTPPDVLITTPESLYLLLTSQARAMFASLETVIVDEIHAMAATKRGAHLFLSLERLEEAAARDTPLQRIGLSATQRPLEEIARLLGGGEPARRKGGAWTPRPVEIVDAGSRKAFELKVEVPVEDMARLGEPVEGEIRSGPAAAPPPRFSIWPSVYPRLVELVRAHRSTMIFANSRRLAERLAGAINETAGEEIALAHHGSVAREKRQEIEDRLKRGTLPAIVATSSLELGIDMGAVDLVIQIEAPPSIASGMQRIGRAGHSVGEVSRGVLFPKYRGDLLAAAAATARMEEGKVEETAYPRNPLDVLAQQIVATLASPGRTAPRTADDLFDLVRRAAPFADLPRASFDGVLDMLSGRYPSDEFAELRPRVTWDRIHGTLRAREGAGRVAIINGGTIPDRGLYGVFLQGEGDGGADPRRSRRVGELDEEMVFESQPGDVFVLGASSWRIEEITHDRVIVSPAPGQPGKMPFWHGDRPGRPLEFGAAIGELARSLVAAGETEAARRLRERHGLDEKAAANLVQYLREQREATGEVPSDRTIVVERFQDEIGDWRVCVMSPFGARVHAPWAAAVRAALQESAAGEVEAIWSDDGMVFRLPESDEPPESSRFLPDPEEIEDRVVRSLGETSLFAARFRENAARALLLPRRHPGRRSPLWAQRKRSADLLAVASRYGSFPILLETYRECLRDVFDLPGLVGLLRGVASRRIRVATVDARQPSPFAASLLFDYVANFIYDGDAPLAERRAQALSVDASQLRELLGEAELRELLDPDAIASLERSLQRLEGHRPRRPDDVHDMLLAIGDLTEPEIRARTETPDDVAAWMRSLASERRAVAVSVGGERRWIAAEDACRYRDAVGAMPPPGLPEAFLVPVDDPAADLLSRYARTHGPFRLDEPAARFGMPPATVRLALERLADRGRVLEGDFLRGGREREWCDAGVLRSVKRRSLARLRREVEPVEPAAFGRFLLEWQGVSRPRAGLDALLTVVEQLQGAPIPASVLEREVLPARLDRYRPADLDTLCAAGEITWRGIEPLGPSDGRVALYLTDRAALLAPPAREAPGELAGKVRAMLAARGALFFADLAAETGAFAGDLVAALWDLVWAGEVTNDTLAPLRSLLRGSGAAAEKKRPRTRGFVSRRAGGPPGSEGRWSLVARGGPSFSETERRAALARVLLERHGVLTREAVPAELVAGGFSAVYPVLKAMEEAGRIRRGYFVAGLGATQFAVSGADDRLRALREPSDRDAISAAPRRIVLSASDPASPWGAALPWPTSAGPGRPQRAAGAHVILRDGALIAWAGRTESNLLTFLPAEEPDRSAAARDLARALADLVDSGRRRAVLVGRVDGVDPRESPLAPYLVEAGFFAGSRGYLKRATPKPAAADRLPTRE